MAKRDFEELFECLSNHRVKALVVGAHAVAHYAKPRYTKDIDVLVEPSAENAESLLKALDDFGFGSLDLTIPIESISSPRSVASSSRKRGNTASPGSTAAKRSSTSGSRS